MEFEVDVKEDSAQPPRHHVIEELEEMGQVDFTKPPIYDLNDGEELEDIGEEECELEEAWQEVELEEPCQVVEASRRGWKGVERALSRSLGTPPPKLPSNPSFEWVKLLTLSFIIPLEFGLLETDGQLRALCGIKCKRRMFSGWRWKSRLIMVGSSRLRSKGCCSSQLNGSRRIVWYLSENSTFLPSGEDYHDQLQDGCENKVWIPDY
ncbi:hypothetical protein AHAS_Ahas18G0166700 [Arachis hypogaea]